MSAIGNTVQCGVYMVNTPGNIYPIPCSTGYGDIGIPNDVDDNYIVYPGFKVGIQANSTYYTLDNTYGTTINFYNINTDRNQATSWDIYYMNEKLV